MQTYTLLVSQPRNNFEWPKNTHPNTAASLYLLPHFCAKPYTPGDYRRKPRPFKWTDLWPLAFAALIYFAVQIIFPKAFEPAPKTPTVTTLFQVNDYNRFIFDYALKPNSQRDTSWFYHDYDNLKKQYTHFWQLLTDPAMSNQVSQAGLPPLDDETRLQLDNLLRQLGSAEPTETDFKTVFNTSLLNKIQEKGRLNDYQYQDYAAYRIAQGNTAVLILVTNRVNPQADYNDLNKKLEDYFKKIRDGYLKQH